MGGCTPPFYDLFLFLTSFFKIRKIFLQVSSKLPQASMIKFFHFSDKWKVVSVAPQKGLCTPHKSCNIFSEILATASRLNTLYGLET